MSSSRKSAVRGACVTPHSNGPDSHIGYDPRGPVRPGVIQAIVRWNVAPAIVPIKNVGPNTPPGAPHPSDTLEVKNFAAVSASVIPRAKCPPIARLIVG